jgi:hypothetical protein
MDECIIIQPKFKPTPTPTTTVTKTSTPTSSVTSSITAQPTNTPTSTRTPTTTNTHTSSQTPTPTNTLTSTHTPTKTPSQTPTTTVTVTPTLSITSSPTTTITRSNTPSRTMRPTPTFQFCNTVDLPSTFTANVVGYGGLGGQVDYDAVFTRNNNTWSASGTFPCGVEYTLSMTCDSSLQKFVYDGSLSCGFNKTVIAPTDSPLILPNSNVPSIVSYSDISNCPPDCCDPVCIQEDFFVYGTPGSSSSGGNCEPAIYGEKTIHIPEGLVPPVLVTMTGGTDDLLIINGQVVEAGQYTFFSNCLVAAGNYSFILNETSFTIAAGDTVSGNSGYSYWICFTPCINNQ